MSKVIILSRMYAGDYLKENIGHEVINLFKSDNGNNYIYVNKDGKIDSKYNNSVEAIILVKHVEKDVMEVVAKAQELEQVLYKSNKTADDIKHQIDYIEQNSITYGGVYIYLVYGNSDIEKITVTFKTNKLRKVQAPVYLVQDKNKLDFYKNSVFLPQKHFSLQSLKMYYSEKELSEDYSILQSMLETEKYWESTNSTETLSLSDIDDWHQRNSFISIIRKEYDELVYSNLLSYIFEQNRLVFLEFAQEVLKINTLTRDYEIIRESENNIDIWIEDDNNVIIIENKIKSKINGEHHNIYSDKVQSQLSKYYNHAKDKCPDKNIYCYIFSPDYNSINLEKYETGKYYKTIKYSQIYNFYIKCAGSMLHTNYFSEFIDAIHLHSTKIDQSNYEIMKNRFISRIKTILEIKSLQG